jgi:peroxidase
MSDIWMGNSQGILRGLIEAEPDNKVDPFIVTDVKDFLNFNPRTTVNSHGTVITQPSVVDLAAININRGREHGVAGYIYYLEYCTGVPIKSWADLKQFIPVERLQRLQTVYRDLNDIDLFVGGLSESKAFGSILGPTFACLNGIQFHHWKYGDRFFFEHGGEAGSFKIEQLNNIRQVSSLANLLCKTTDFDYVQANPQFRASEHNPKVPCHAFAEFDYHLWSESGHSVPDWKKK